MLPFPNISPEIFSFELFGMNLALRWYAVSYIMGFVCALSLMKHFVRRPYLWANDNPPMGSDLTDTLLTYLILGVIIGGRLGYVLFYNFNYYFANPFDILRVWDGGMSFHGGFIGVILAGTLFCKIYSIPLWPMADLIALSTPPGLLFGRVANFINAELWGRPTTVPWGVVFPGDRAQDCDGVLGVCARHPSQLYEAGLEGCLLFLVLYILGKGGALRLRGLTTGVFVSGYGLSRFLVEFFRVPDPQFLSDSNPFGLVIKLGSFGFTMGQTLCLPMIFVGLVLIFGSLRRSSEKKL